MDINNDDLICFRRSVALGMESYRESFSAPTLSSNQSRVTSTKKEAVAVMGEKDVDDEESNTEQVEDVRWENIKLMIMNKIQ